MEWVVAHKFVLEFDFQESLYEIVYNLKTMIGVYIFCKKTLFWKAIIQLSKFVNDQRLHDKKDKGLTNIFIGKYIIMKHSLHYHNHCILSWTALSWNIANG